MGLEGGGRPLSIQTQNIFQRTCVSKTNFDCYLVVHDTNRVTCEEYVIVGAGGEEGITVWVGCSITTDISIRSSIIYLWMYFLYLEGMPNPVAMLARFWYAFLPPINIPLVSRMVPIIKITVE